MDKGSDPLRRITLLRDLLCAEGLECTSLKNGSREQLGMRKGVVWVLNLISSPLPSILIGPIRLSPTHAHTHVRMHVHAPSYSGWGACMLDEGRAKSACST